MENPKVSICTSIKKTFVYMKHVPGYYYLLNSESSNFLEI